MSPESKEWCCSIRLLNFPTLLSVFGSSPSPFRLIIFLPGTNCSHLSSLKIAFAATWYLRSLCKCISGLKSKWSITFSMYSHEREIICFSPLLLCYCFEVGSDWFPISIELWNEGNFTEVMQLKQFLIIEWSHMEKMMAVRQFCISYTNLRKVTVFCLLTCLGWVETWFMYSTLSFSICLHWI